jgi:hypothetical protein
MKTVSGLETRVNKLEQVQTHPGRHIVLRSTDFFTQDERETRKREILQENPQNHVVCVNVVDGSKGPEEPAVTRWRK